MRFNPRRVNPEGLRELLGRNPEELVRRDGQRHAVYLCPFTGMEVRMSFGHGDAEHRGLCHFAHRWAAAARHLRAAGLTAEEMLHPLSLLFDRIFAESEVEARREMGVGWDGTNARTATEIRHRARGYQDSLGAAVRQESIDAMLRLAELPARIVNQDMLDAMIYGTSYATTRVAPDPRREKAEATARKLLVKCLTPEQRSDFEKNDAFDVEVTRAGEVTCHPTHGDPLGQLTRSWAAGIYRISKSATFNVTHTESGTRFCVVAAESVPVYDQMLTQKLLLERTPERFFATANVSVRPQPFIVDSADPRILPGRIWLTRDDERRVSFF